MGQPIESSNLSPSVLKIWYNHKRAKSENSFSFFGSAVIIYPKVFASSLLVGV